MLQEEKKCFITKGFVGFFLEKSMSILCFVVLSESIVECINQSLDVGRSYENDCINVSFCFFVRFDQFIGDGGVIFVNTQE